MNIPSDELTFDLDNKSITMNEDVFWRIIQLFNWKKTGNEDLVVKPCIDVLKQMSNQEWDYNCQEDNYETYENTQGWENKEKLIKKK